MIQFTSRAVSSSFSSSTYNSTSFWDTHAYEKNTGLNSISLPRKLNSHAISSNFVNTAASLI